MEVEKATSMELLLVQLRAPCLALHWALPMAASLREQSLDCKKGKWTGPQRESNLGYSSEGKLELLKE